MTRDRSDPAWTFDNKAFNDALVKRGINSYSVEGLSGVDHSVLYRLQRGMIKTPSSATLLSIAAALDMDPRDLMVRQW